MTVTTNSIPHTITADYSFQGGHRLVCHIYSTIYFAFDIIETETWREVALLANMTSRDTVQCQCLQAFMSISADTRKLE